jgi:hypothetical protein
MRKAGERPIEAVCRAIGRKSGLQVVTCRHDGTQMGRSRPVAEHYQLTLGRRIARRYGGGYAVEGELWVAVSIDGTQD